MEEKETKRDFSWKFKNNMLQKGRSRDAFGMLGGG